MITVCMKFILPIILMVCMTMNSLSQNSKTELDVLTENYVRARERVVKPVDDKYKEELKRLLEKYSKQGNIKEVEKIALLLKDSSDDSLSSLEKRLSDTIWKTAYGSEFQFKEHGAGIKTSSGVVTTFMWRVVDNNTLIEFIGRMNVDSPPVVEYIRVDDSNTAFIGKDKSNINSPLSRIK